MPQFDQFSFFNQVLWFFFLFFTFYFLISYYFLPTICYNLKFRKKKINFNNKIRNQINFENQNLFFFFNNLNKDFYLKYEHFIKKKQNIYFLIQKQNLFTNLLINNLFINKITTILNKKYLLSKKIIFNI